MSNLNLLLIFLSWGINSYILYQYIKKKINRPNTLDRYFYALISGAVILFVLKELFFFLKIHSIINVIMLIILDAAVLALVATFFVNRLHVNTQEVFGIPNPKRKFLYAVLAFFFIFALTGATIPNKWSYADSNETVVHHKKKNDNQSKKETTPKKKKEEQFTVYKVNVTKISENSSHDYLEVSGTTKASDGSKIYVSMNDKDHPDTTTNAFNNSDEEDMATVKNHKFTAYVSINYISTDSNYKVGSELEFLISAFSGIKHDAEDDFSDDQVSKLIDESTVEKYKITKAIHNQFKPASDKKEDTDSDNDNDDSDYDSNDDDTDDSNDYEADIDESRYTDDLKDDVYDQLSDELNIDKVKIGGQFTFNPASLVVSIYSPDFYERPDYDYEYIDDALKVIKDYDPEDFKGGIEVILYGQVVTAYDTEYRPIQSYSFDGDTVAKVNPDNLSEEAMEILSTDHYYIHFNN
ncbi:hypothetical protein AKUH4B410M_04840 [Apilactobacillus kunkeei]|nr:hypothetical protein AKUH4B405J_04840 [Apilactobacillus kunkeei]CAI2580889.1 hypothetical protein AKUH4B102A_04860 [Apilactobacillus kunkeei]CAI2581920.1 hypothetical protein AKUH4B410M_04840 [Apilactobacillus kunkeei]CAI2652746.1 hypothetical protein AKUH3B102X_04830 [Apilactobacillus kunkeei]